MPDYCRSSGTRSSLIPVPMKAAVIRYPTKKAPLFGKKTHLQEKKGVINNSYMSVHLLIMSAVTTLLANLRPANSSHICKEGVKLHVRLVLKSGHGTLELSPEIYAYYVYNHVVKLL